MYDEPLRGERARIDASLVERGLDASTRQTLWESVDRILGEGPASPGGAPGKTGLALGYVQSGKTTAITALIAAAADAGYEVVIALLGSTNLLLRQNEERLLTSLGLSSRGDYQWVHMTNPSGVAKAKELKNWLDRGRVVLVPVLKHAGRIEALAGVLQGLASGTSVLIVDDEADQASLNTEVKKESESKTYEAISRLRSAAPHHLYVQFTATPYAPLLLEPHDHLRPDFVELLQPGPGYTGGREFFVDNADLVVRPIPTLDEQRPKTLPTQLPRSLVDAFANFVAGASLLLAVDRTAAPVSMLVHSTQRNDVQARYHFLLQRLLKQWTDAAAAATSTADLPAEIPRERATITSLGAPDLDDATFLDGVRYVLRETTLWLVNSASDINKVEWHVAPVHVLVGGNKLDRGFTVEGLTVTYMNRPASEQLDTLEQRARAFGYRADLLPYCQFYATPRTLKVLREIVDTEYDLRSNLQDWLAEGGSPAEWADQLALLLPEGTRPTRQSVLTALARFNERPGWHQLRRPSTAVVDRVANGRLVAELELESAPKIDYGRLSHRTLELPLVEVVDRLIRPWQGVSIGSSPGWRHEDLVEFLDKLAVSDLRVPLILLEHPDGGARSRDWSPELGFTNLMQGADPRQRAGGGAWYAGDRALGGVDLDPEQVVVLVHRVQSVQPGVVPELFTLAVHAGSRQLVRRA